MAMTIRFFGGGSGGGGGGSEREVKNGCGASEHFCSSSSSPHRHGNPREKPRRYQLSGSSLSILSRFNRRLGDSSPSLDSRVLKSTLSGFSSENARFFRPAVGSRQAKYVSRETLSSSLLIFRPIRRLFLAFTPGLISSRPRV